MIALGVDPDLHNTAFALVEILPGRGPRVRKVGVSTVSGKIKGLEAAAAQSREVMRYVPEMVEGKPLSIAVVESQQVYVGNSKARPNDLIKIATVSGAAIAGLAQVRWDTTVCLVLPRTWKGSVPKGIHQSRICKALGFDFEFQGKSKPVKVLDTPYPIPAVGIKKISQTKWNHLIDACGLALWGLTVGCK